MRVDEFGVVFLVKLYQILSARIDGCYTENKLAVMSTNKRNNSFVLITFSYVLFIPKPPTLNQVNELFPQFQRVHRFLIIVML